VYLLRAARPKDGNAEQLTKNNPGLLHSFAKVPWHEATNA
jgi:hypothetical protein